MYQMNNLADIINDYKPLKNAIDYSINCDKKRYIRNGLSNPIPMRKLSEKEILFGIHSLIRDEPRDMICLAITDIIDWTPVKLFQTAYFMVRMYDKFWIISRDFYNCIVVAVINMKDYIQYIYNIGIKENNNYIEDKYYPVFSKFRAALKLLEKSDFALIESTSFELKIKINHYLYKQDKIIYYIPVYYNNDSICIYKPAIFSTLTK
jgi:hypothetical protein